MNGESLESAVGLHDTARYNATVNVGTITPIVSCCNSAPRHELCMTLLAVSPGSK